MNSIDPILWLTGMAAEDPVKTLKGPCLPRERRSFLDAPIDSDYLSAIPELSLSCRALGVHLSEEGPDLSERVGRAFERECSGSWSSRGLFAGDENIYYRHFRN